MDTLIDFLAEARSAHQRNDWRASYAAFVRADGLGAMPTDDLEAYSAAAWRLGYGNEAVRLAERVYDRLVRTDPAAAAMKAAELALEWHARGHTRCHSCGQIGRADCSPVCPRAEPWVIWPISTPLPHLLPETMSR